MNYSSYSIKESPAGNALITFQVGSNILSIYHDRTSDTTQFFGTSSQTNEVLFSDMANCITENLRAIQQRFEAMDPHATWLRSKNREEFNKCEQVYQKLEELWKKTLR